MSESVRKKLLGAEFNSDADQAIDEAEISAKAEGPPVDVDAMLKKIEFQRLEIEGLKADLQEKALEVSKLSAYIEVNEKKYYQEAVDRGREEGLKSFNASLEVIAEGCKSSIASLESFLHDAVNKEKSFIQDNIAGVVSISVAKILGDIKIPPNYLYDKIVQLIEVISPEQKVDIQMGVKLYEALMSNKAVFDRVGKLARITGNADLHPFDLLIEAEDQVVDAGYLTQVGNLHSLISQAMA